MLLFISLVYLTGAMYNTTVNPELAIKLIYICGTQAGNLKNIQHKQLRTMCKQMKTTQTSQTAHHIQQHISNYIPFSFRLLHMKV